MKQAKDLSRRGFLAAAATGAACFSVREVVKVPTFQPTSPSLSLKALTAESFFPHLGAKFRVFDKSRLMAEVELIDVSNDKPSKSDRRPTSLRKPFSVQFRGPNIGAVSQGSYVLEHDTFGRVELFLVPVGRQLKAMNLLASFA